jgi:hypothetical protein
VTGAPLLQAITQAARELPAGQALRLAEELAHHPDAASAVRGGLPALVPTAAFQQAAHRLVRAWGTASGEMIALGLQAAVTAVETTRADQVVDIVWTGPQTP